MTAAQQTTVVNKQTAVSIALVVVLLGVVSMAASQFASLKGEVVHLSNDLGKVQKSVDKLQEHYMGISAKNTGHVQIILERMQQDDARERKDTSSIEDLNKRVLMLEAASKGK